MRKFSREAEQIMIERFGKDAILQKQLFHGQSE